MPREIEYYAEKIDAGEPLDSKFMADSMMDAVQEGDLELIRFLSSSGVSINIHNEDTKNGMTPLMYAISINSPGVVNYILDMMHEIAIETGNFNEINFVTPVSKHGLQKINKTALLIAIDFRNTAIIDILLERGADINYKGTPERPVLSPAQYAMQQGLPGILDFLKSKGATLDEVETYIQNYQQMFDEGVKPTSTYMIRALMDAIKDKKIDLINFLIDKGVDINAVNYNGLTPLTIAISSGSIDIVKRLLELGADVNKPTAAEPIVTPLALAVIKKNTDIVRLLISNGANVNDTNGYSGNSPLNVAILFREMDSVKLLLENGADVNLVSASERIPLFALLTSLNEENSIPILKMLIHHDLNINGKFKDETALNYAVRKIGDPELIRVLLANGADANALSRGTPPLYAAIGLMEKNKDKQLEIVSLLLEHRAKPDTKFRGRTMYQYAKDIGKELGDLLRTKMPEFQGVFKQDIEQFNVFLAIPDYPENATEEQKIEAINTAERLASNTSLCPVCLEYAERSMGCLYMHHVCPPDRRHERLYNVYRNDIGEIWWCTDCGRICRGHRHYALAPAMFNNTDEVNRPPELLPASDNPFDKTCFSQGGGSVKEKLKRISRMIEFYSDMQSLVGTPQAAKDVEVRDMVIEESWNAPMSRIVSHMVVDNVRRWRTNLDVFPRRTIADVVEEELVIPPGLYETPVLHPASLCLTDIPDLDEPDKPAIQFIHKNREGVMFNHVYADGNRFMCKGELVSFINTMGEKRGRCFDDDCGGYLYPPELRKAFELFGEITPEDEALLQKYTNRFPRHRGGAKLPSIHELFHPMTNGQCYLPPKKNGITYKQNKRAGGRTRKHFV